MGKKPTAAKITDEQIIAALEKSMGFYSQSAKMLGCNRRTIARRMDASAELREAYADIMEQHKDGAEFALFKAINRGEAWAVCFYLKCKGRDRGYIEYKPSESPTESDGRKTIPITIYKTSKGGV